MNKYTFRIPVIIETVKEITVNADSEREARELIQDAHPGVDYTDGEQTGYQVCFNQMLCTDRMLDDENSLRWDDIVDMSQHSENGEEFFTEYNGKRYVVIVDEFGDVRSVESSFADPDTFHEVWANLPLLNYRFYRDRTIF